MRQKILQITREWLGTPYHHQESQKGIGCDCLGLILGVRREVYNVGDPEPVPNYSPSWGDHRTDDPLLNFGEKYFLKVKEPKIGDILLFRMRPNIAVKHCAILSDKGIIHSYSNHVVREEHFSNWWKKRLVASFQFPEKI